MDKDRLIASVAMPLSGALEKKLVKSRSSGWRNCDASIPLRILELLLLFLLLLVVESVFTEDGVDNAPVVIGRSASRASIIVFFILFFFGLLLVMITLIYACGP